MHISAGQFKSNGPVLGQHKWYFSVARKKLCGPLQIWHACSNDSSKTLLTFLTPSIAREHLEQKWTDMPDGNATA